MFSVKMFSSSFVVLPVGTLEKEPVEAFSFPVEAYQALFGNVESISAFIRTCIFSRF